ncbi:MAG: hypothetical protein J0H45_09630, partial [Stenotrophomonas nitritireducens]|nr:hypothetical protein [Stenotrophomonas nitritireducens]
MSHRVGAGLATAAILCLFARVLWQVPEPDPKGRAQRLQVRWLPRYGEAPALPPAADTPEVPAGQAHAALP